MPPPTKRRKVSTNAVEEISFDFDARHTFLTGFHKRKQQRVKQAQEEAAEKERLQRIEARKQIREQRKQDIENHVAEVNALLKQAAQQEQSSEETEESDEADEDGEEELDPAQTAVPNFSNREEEYVDEDKFTTVTVQAMNLSESDEEGEHEDGEESIDPEGADDTKKRKVWTKEKPKSNKPKKRKKKFRYQTKVERKADRAKVKEKKRRQAKARRGDASND